MSIADDVGKEAARHGDRGFVVLDKRGRVLLAVPDGSGAEPLARYVAWRKGNATGSPPVVVEVIRRTFPSNDPGEPATLELLQVQGSVGWSDVSEESLALARRTLGHDLNNPLAAILGATDLMLLMGVSSDVRREIERVIEQTARMTTVVRRFVHPDQRATKSVGRLGKDDAEQGSAAG